jgi:hypothetical protein
MSAPLGPAALLALSLTFLLPFMEFSCQEKKALTFTGYEAAFGKEIKAELPLGKWLEGKSRQQDTFSFKIEQSNRTEGRPMVLAALVVAILGGIAAFIKRPLGAAAGLVVCVLLLMAQNQAQSEVQAQQIPLLTLSFTYGFWLSLALAASGGVLCLLEKRRA